MLAGTRAKRAADARTGAKIVFLAFRQQTETLQGVLVISGDKDENKVSKQMLKYAQGITVSSASSFLLLFR